MLLLADELKLDEILALLCIVAVRDEVRSHGTQPQLPSTFLKQAMQQQLPWPWRRYPEFLCHLCSRPQRQRQHGHSLPYQGDIPVCANNGMLHRGTTAALHNCNNHDSLLLSMLLLLLLTGVVWCGVVQLGEVSAAAAAGLYFEERRAQLASLWLLLQAQVWGLGLSLIIIILIYC